MEKAAVYHRLRALGAAGKVCCGMMRALFYGGMITVARFFYSLLFALLLPLILLFMAWQGRKNKGWRQRWSERFGRVVHRPQPGGLWIHAASVGEVLAAAPLVRAFRQQHPAIPLIMTTFTPTGSAQVRRLFGTGVYHMYLPLDLPWMVRRFLRTLQPALLVIIERELWPNMLAACEEQGVPVLLANARLSEKSALTYQKYPKLALPMLQQLTRVAVQDATDGERYLQLGLPEQRLEVTGSVKFDIDVPEGVVQQGAALRAQWGAQRPVLALASSHENEDEQLLDLYPALLETCPDLLLLLIPRHPERFEAVTNAALTRQLKVQRRSKGAVSPAVQVYVADSMGEMLTLLAAADLVLMGGSLIPRGGHNPIEPAALGKATLMGPYHHNFAQIVADLQQLGALQTVPAEPQQLLVALREWLADNAGRQAMGAAGLAAVEANRGAVARLVGHCEELMRLRN